MRTIGPEISSTTTRDRHHRSSTTTPTDASPAATINPAMIKGTDSYFSATIALSILLILSVILVGLLILKIIKIRRSSRFDDVGVWFRSSLAELRMPLIFNPSRYRSRVPNTPASEYGQVNRAFECTSAVWIFTDCLPDIFLWFIAQLRYNYLFLPTTIQPHCCWLLFMHDLVLIINILGFSATLLF